MRSKKFGVFCVVDEIAVAVVKNRILRTGTHVPVYQAEVTVLREEEKIFVSGRRQ